jgi:hypothetical protein
VAAALDGTIDVTQVFSTLRLCRAARRWLGGDLGDYSGYGGDSSAVAAALDGTIDVTQVFSTRFCLCRAARRWLGGDLGDPNAMAATAAPWRRRSMARST